MEPPVGRVHELDDSQF